MQCNIRMGGMSCKTISLENTPNTISSLLKNRVRPSDAIFDSIREDYDDFDIWFAKCRTEKRKCWIINDESTIAGVVIFNDETDKQKEWPLAGRKVLKICTFKISEKYRGGRLGEQFVRQILWYAYENRYESVYLTAFAKQDILINLISYYGFREVGRSAKGEICFEKEWVNVKAMADRFLAARSDYPRLPEFSSDAFLIPIKYVFSQRLFPEIDSLSHKGQLSLFQAVGINSVRETLIPSTSIRKAYVCNAATGFNRKWFRSGLLPNCLPKTKVYHNIWSRME